MTPQTPSTVRIARLRSHPGQCLYAGTLAPADERALHEVRRASCQRDPIKPLGDGTIVDGHQRVRLLEKLCRTEVLAMGVKLAADIAAAHARLKEGGLLEN